MALSQSERALLEAIRKDTDTALSEIAERHGLQSLRLGNMILDRAAGVFNSKVTGTLRGAAGKEGREYDLLRTYGGSYATLPERGEWLGSVRPVGATSRRPHKVIFEKPDGKRYVMKARDFILRYCVDRSKMRPSEFAMLAADLEEG